MSKVISLNVGGKIFQTTPETLTGADPDSVLSNLRITESGSLPFFDRDPELFQNLLYILRHGSLPQTLKTLTLGTFPDSLVAEARFYGAEAALRAAARPRPLNGLDLERESLLIPNGRDFPSAIAAVAEDGSIAVAHGSKISPYDSFLRRRRATVTCFSCVDALALLTPSLAAAGAVDRAGLHFFDLGTYACSHVVHWNIPEAPGIALHDPTVQALAVSRGDKVFAAFESSRKNANTVLVIDGRSLQVSGELGRQLGGAADLEAPGKLEWVDSQGLLFCSSVTGAAFGHSGVLRVFDVRVSQEIWKFRESTSGTAPGSDCFADVVWSEELQRLFKVNVRSGKVSMADLRKLGEWESCGSANEDFVAGAHNRLLAHGRQLFCCRGGDLEVWCELGAGLRRCSVGKRGGERITHMVAAGERLFFVRNGLQGIEVWQSSSL